MTHGLGPLPCGWLVHEDEDLLVLDKPAGLLAVPGRGADKADCLSARAMERWPDARIVHRLDQATSGLMVLARGAVAQRALDQAFAQRRVRKRYEAIVHGLVLNPDGDGGWGVIDLPLAPDWPRRPRSKVGQHQGKPSRTHWQVLARDTASNTSRLALEPITKRSHQLRVHLLAIGHPTVGDALYGPPDSITRLMLHACALALSHPVTDEIFRAGFPRLYSRLPTSSRRQNYPACTKGAGVTVEPRSDSWMRLPAALAGVFNRRLRVEPLRHLAFVCKEPS